MIGQVVAKGEVEDKVPSNQFDNMQEIANAPFGPKTNISKEEYVKKMTQLEEAE